MSKPLVTIFVGSTNRIETLKRTLAAFGELNTPHEIGATVNIPHASRPETHSLQDGNISLFIHHQHRQ